MKPITISHTAIAGRPLIERKIQTFGCTKGKEYAISYGSTCGHESLVDAYVVKQKEFPLHRIIKDYVSHYGYEKATEILVEKGIINLMNKTIIT
jgi:hypothetical protein